MPQQEFPLEVPRLLDDETIEAVRKRLSENRVNGHQQPDRYLLTGKIFCAHCGMGLVGQHQSGVRRYRHKSKKIGQQRTCEYLHGYISADQLETSVLGDLQDLTSDADRLALALSDALPDSKEQERLAEARELAEQRLAKAEAGIKRLAAVVARGTMTDQQVDAAMQQHEAMEQAAVAELGRIDAQLVRQPSKLDLRKLLGRVAKAHYLANWSKAEQRALLRAVFDGVAPDGRELGVYVTWDQTEKTGSGQRPYSYQLLGTVNGLSLTAGQQLTPEEYESLEEPDKDPANWLCEEDYVAAGSGGESGVPLRGRCLQSRIPPK